MRNVMKHLASLLLLLSVICFSSFAQQSDSLINGNATTSKALQINILNETAFYYYTDLAGSYPVRFGCSLIMSQGETGPSTGETHYEQTGDYPVTTDETNTTSSTSKNYSISVAALYLIPLNNSRQLQFNIGIGPTINYYYGHSSSTYEVPRDSTRTEYISTNKNEGYGVGAQFCLQIIIPLYSNLQIAAEYTLVGYYSWLENESNQEYHYFTRSTLISGDEQKYSYDSKAWQISLSNIKVGLKYSF